MSPVSHTLVYAIANKLAFTLTYPLLTLLTKEQVGHSSSIYTKLHSLWSPEVQCHIHKGSLIILSRVESTHFLLLTFISLRYILIFSSHLCLGVPECPLPIGLPAKILKALLPSSILATCPAHFNFVDFVLLYYNNNNNNNNNNKILRIIIIEIIM